MGTTTTIVGGGIAGLVAAITAAEHGADVELHEARSHLGGRARSATGDFAANWGPHALYCDGSFWAWLAERDLLPPHAKPMRSGFRLRHRGRVRRTPPKAVLPAVGLLRRHRTAPADVSFREWVAGHCGDETAAALSGLGGVLTMHHDPGSLSADFVWERMRRNATFPPVARYPLGGWTTLVDTLAGRASELGVRIATSSPVDHLPTERGPVVVAVEQPAARKLLGDDELGWHGARTALLDVGLESRRGDPFVVADLDEAGWVERFSGPDPSVAPDGRTLLQASIGLRPDEPLDGGVARVEALLDGAFAGWRDREVWRRRASVDRQSGAVDPPGTTWRDRPAIDRGGGVFLAGDWVATPGFYAEVAANSGVEAGRAAAASVTPSGRRVAAT